MNILYILILLTMALIANEIEEATKPLYVDFAILGAVIAPTKADGTTWDKTLSTSKKKSSLSLIDNMVSSSHNIEAIAVDKVINIIAKNSVQGQSAPDVIGYVTQIGYSSDEFRRAINMPVGLANKKSLSKNCYTPDFNTSYLGWPIYKNTRFRIKLYDADLIDNDPIGTVEVTYEDIMTAIKNNKPTWINVSKEGGDQLLFVQISASKVIGKEKPDIQGVAWK